MPCHRTADACSEYHAIWGDSRHKTIDAIEHRVDMCRIWTMHGRHALSTELSVAAMICDMLDAFVKAGR